MADEAELRRVLDVKAFRREFRAPKKERREYLPDEPEWNVMRVCMTATGDATTAREWYRSVPLSEVYKWIAIRIAEAPEE